MADVRYVKPGGTDTLLTTNPAAGTSIPLAWATIQFSLDQMITLPAGKKELRLVGAPGGAGWKENVTMKGAKYSDITVIGWTDHGAVTIQEHKDYDWGSFCEGRPPIDGAKKGPVFTIEDATGIVLQDLRIENGQADLGAGVHATKSEVNLVKCCIHDNTATPHTGSGGGFAFDRGNPHGLSSKIDGCVVFSNTAGKDGGGGWIKDNEGKVTITQTEFQDNSAEEDGGAVALIDCREIEVLQHCLFGGGGHKNTAKKGGAVAVSGNLKPITIGDPTKTADKDKNRFEDNVAAQAGGGIRIFKGKESVVVGGTVIKTNHADSTGAKTADGGGIAIRQFELSDRPKAQVRKDARLQILQNTTIDQNTADRYGGGIFATIGSLVDIVDGDPATITIDGNKAEHGAGIYASLHSDVTATGGEINSNTAASGTGGGLFISNGPLELTGVAVDQNTARTGGGAYVETRIPLAADEKEFVKALTSAVLAVAPVQISAGATASGSLSNNTATAGNGGGLACDGDPYKEFPLDVTVRGVSVSQNTAHEGGGGIDIINVRTAKIDGNCSFYKNSAGIQGGALSVHHATGLSVIDNTQGFVENKAATGGGFYVSKCEISAATVSGNTFSGNTLTGARGVGRDGVFDQCTFNPAGLDIASIEAGNTPAGAAQPSFIKK